MAQLAGDYGNKTIVSAAPAAAAVAAPAVTPQAVAAVQPYQAPAAYVPQTISMADIYKDPTILAFLRSSGLTEQVAANEIARRQSAVNQALATNLDDLTARGQQERRGINDSMVARNQSRSGENLRRQAEQEQQQARMQGAMQQQAMNQVNDLSGNLTMMVAQNQQKAAEMGTQTYMDRALAAGKSTIDSNYSGAPGTSVYDQDEDQ